MNLSRLTGAEGKKKGGRPRHESLEDVLGKRPENGKTQMPNAALAKDNAERAAAVKPYTDGMEFDKDRVRMCILNAGADAAEAWVRMGKYLVWAKEEMGHGAFESWLEEEMGLSHQRASEMMRVARRFVESRSPNIRQFLLQASANNKKKLLAFCEVTDDEMEEALETKTLAGKPLDEIETLPYRELKSALRKDREKLARITQEKEEEKQRRLDVETELERMKTGRRPRAAVTEMDRQWLVVQQEITALEGYALEFVEEYDEDGLMDPEVLLQTETMIRMLRQKVDLLREILIPEAAEEARRRIMLGQPMKEPAPKLSMIRIPEEVEEGEGE